VSFWSEAFPDIGLDGRCGSRASYAGPVMDAQISLPNIAPRVGSEEVMVIKSGEVIEGINPAAVEMTGRARHTERRSLRCHRKAPEKEKGKMFEKPLLPPAMSVRVKISYDEVGEGGGLYILSLRRSC